MESLQPIEQVEGQLSLFEVRQFLGRACLIIDNVVYPQFELGEDVYDLENFVEIPKSESE